MNPCGHEQWESHADGTTTLFGTEPTWAAESPKRRELLQSWENWSSEIAAAADEYDVPLPWIVGVMATETGLWSRSPEAQRTIVSSAGAAGPMQIMPGTAGFLGFSANDRFDPAKNIAMGAKLLGMHLDKGLPGAGAVYNSGRYCCPGRNALDLCMASYDGMTYAEHAVRHANTAAELQLGAKPLLGWLLVVAGAGLAAAAAVPVLLRR